MRWINFSILDKSLYTRYDSPCIKLSRADKIIRKRMKNYETNIFTFFQRVSLHLPYTLDQLKITIKIARGTGWFIQCSKFMLLYLEINIRLAKTNSTKELIALLKFFK